MIYAKSVFLKIITALKTNTIYKFKVDKSQFNTLLKDPRLSIYCAIYYTLIY